MRTALPGPDGVPYATFARAERDGRPLADDLRPRQGVPPDRVAAAALAGLPGWLVSVVPGRLEAALIAAGAIRRRHAHVLRLDLGTTPPRAPAPPPPGITMRAFAPDDVTAALGAISLAAYPDEHPDATPGLSARDAAGELRRIVRGEVAGPLHPASRVATSGPEGPPLGAVLVNDQAGTGPWITELFRTPTAAGAGLGAALLDGAIAGVRAAGGTSVGLAVTEGNPARRLYVSRGFALQASGVTLLLPG